MAKKGNGVPTQADKVIPRSIEFTFYFLVFVTIASGFFWWTQQAPIAILERQLLTPIVKIGGELQIRNVLYISDRCDITVSRQLIDINGLVHTVVAQRLPEERLGERIIYISSVTIPATIPPGKVVYRVSATWSCNVIQDLLPTTVALSDIEVIIEE